MLRSGGLPKSTQQRNHRSGRVRDGVHAAPWPCQECPGHHGDVMIYIYTVPQHDLDSGFEWFTMIDIYIYIYLFIRTHTHIYIYIYSYICIYIYMHLYLNTYMHACMHAYIHTYIHTH